MALDDGFVAAMGDFFANVYNGVMSSLHEYTRGLFTSLMSSFVGWAELIVAVYIICVGFNIFRGNYKESTKQAATSVVLIIVLQSVIFESSAYFSWIVDPFINIPKDISGFFINKGMSATTGASSFDDIMQQIGLMFVSILKFADNAQPTGSILSDAWIMIERFFAILILFVAFCICVGTFIALQIMATIAQYILLIIGGICIFFVSFKGTRHIFWAWLRAMFNYSLIIVFSSIILSITFTSINDSILKLETVDVEQSGVFTIPYFTTVALCFISFFVLLKTPDFAAAISGGQAGGTQGIAGGVGMVTGNIAGAGATGARLAAPRIAGAAKWAGQGIASGASRLFSKLRGF